jgi:hypothetical protein
MTELELSNYIRLSCQRALLGTVTPNLRMVTIGWDELKFFHLRAYYSSTPSDGEIEEMESASAEVIADFPFEKDQVECLPDTRMRKDLEVLKYVVFARKE